MATDTAPAPAPAETAAAEPTAPPVAVTPQAPARVTTGNLSLQEVRRNALVDAFRTPTTPELMPDSTTPERAPTIPTTGTPEPTAAKAEKATPKAQVDKKAEKPDTATQTQVQTGSPPEGKESASASTARPEPATSAVIDQTASSDSTATAQAEKSAKPVLPDEYQTAEHDALYKADPLLRRTVNSLWNEPNLSAVAKVQKIEAKIAQSQAKLAQAQTVAQEDDRLWDEGDYETLRQRQLAKREQRTLTVEAEQTLTKLLATATGVDPDDEGFLSAGNEAQTPDERFRLFGEWVVNNSPVGKTALQDRVSAATESHQSEVTTLKAQFAEEKKALEATFKDDMATAIEKARSEARAGNPPPRARASLPEGVEATRPIGPTMATAREAIRQGFAMREAN